MEQAIKAAVEQGPGRGGEDGREDPALLALDDKIEEDEHRHGDVEAEEDDGGEEGEDPAGGDEASMALHVGGNVPRRLGALVAQGVDDFRDGEAEEGGADDHGEEPGLGRPGPRGDGAPGGAERGGGA